MKFELFGRLRKKNSEEPKKTEEDKTSKKASVEERVSFLVSEGLAEPEIIKILKDEGYSFQEIDSGISNILRSSVSNEQFTDASSSPSEAQGLNNFEDLAPLNIDEKMHNTSQQMQAEIIDQMDAIMEQMIEEKVSDFSEEFNRIDMKFEGIENKLQNIISKLGDIEEGDKKHEDDTDEKIAEIGSKETNLEPRITSLEKAFKDIIPGIVESIRELKEINMSKKRQVSVQDIESAEKSFEAGAEEAPEKNELNIFD